MNERRQYQRVRAPVLCRPAGFSLGQLFRKNRADAEQAIDVSLGGLRIYSDEEIKIGTRLEVELFLPDRSSLICRVEVAWIESIPGGSPAAFDVGLRFTEIRTEDKDRLRTMIGTDDVG